MCSVWDKNTPSVDLMKTTGRPAKFNIFSFTLMLFYLSLCLSKGFSVYASRPIVGLVGTTRNIQLLGLKELSTPCLQNYILVILLALMKGLVVLFVFTKKQTPIRSGLTF